MSDLNKCMFIGRLGADPETRYTASGAAITNINIATTNKWRDKQTGEQREQTEWHRIVFFNRLAEVVGEYCRKGSQIFVEGGLRHRKWQDQSGQDRYTTEVVGENMQLLGSPRGQQEGQQQGSAKQQNPQQQDADPGFDEDDIPF